jgi:hypothetical protein
MFREVEDKSMRLYESEQWKNQDQSFGHSRNKLYNHPKFVQAVKHFSPSTRNEE